MSLKKILLLNVFLALVGAHCNKAYKSLKDSDSTYSSIKSLNTKWAKIAQGGASNKAFTATAIDSLGNVYAAGYQKGTGSFTYGKAITAKTSSTNDFEHAVLIKYNSEGRAQWAKVAAGPKNSNYYALAIDSEDNVFVAGRQQGTGSFNYGDDVNVSANYNDFNSVIVKFNSDGETQWAQTVIDGGNKSQFYALVIDGSDNIYAAGVQNGTGTFDYGNSIEATATYASGSNSVLVKYDSSGDAQDAQTVTSSNQISQYRGLAVDSNDNIYAIGFQRGNNSFSYGTATDATISAGFASGSNSVIVKYDSNGDAEWARTVETAPSFSVFHAVSVDSSDSIYVAGLQNDDEEFDYGNLVKAASNTAAKNSVLVKYDSDGYAQWASVVKDGGADSVFFSVAIDSSDNVFAAGGQDTNANFNYGNSIEAQAGYANGSNSVVVKFDSDGLALWAQTLENSSDESGFQALAVDSNGDIYLAGWQHGKEAFTYDSATAESDFENGENSVLIKYDTDGAAQWAEVATGGSDHSNFRAIATDSAGNIYAAGYQNGSGVFTFGNDVSTETNYSGKSSLLVKYNGEGEAQWATFAKGQDDSEFLGLAVDSAGNVYAVGYQIEDNTFTYGTENITADFDGGPNAVLVKYNSDGEAQWAKTVTGGAGESEFYSVAIDSERNVYVAGYQYDTGTFTYDSSNNITATANYSDLNSVLAKYNSNGETLWAMVTTDGGADSTFKGIAVDSEDSIYAVGFQTGTANFTYGNGTSLNASADYSGNNSVIIKFNSEGGAEWARVAQGGSNDSEFNGVAVDSQNNVYAVGYQTGSQSFDYGSNATTASNGDEENSVLAKFNSDGDTIWAKTTNDGNGASIFTSVATYEDYVYVVGHQYGAGTYTYDENITATAKADATHGVLVVYHTFADAQWARAMGANTSGDVFINHATVDNSGMVYTAGSLNSTSVIDFGNDITTQAEHHQSNGALVKFE